METLAPSATPLIEDRQQFDALIPIDHQEADAVLKRYTNGGNHFSTGQMVEVGADTSQMQAGWMLESVRVQPVSPDDNAPIHQYAVLSRTRVGADGEKHEDHMPIPLDQLAANVRITTDASWQPTDATTDAEDVDVETAPAEPALSAIGEDHADAISPVSHAATTEAGVSTDSVSEAKVINDPEVLAAITHQVAELDGYLNLDSKVREHVRGNVYSAKVNHYSPLSSRNAEVRIEEVSSGQPVATLGDGSFGNNGASKASAVHFNTHTREGGRLFVRHYDATEANGSQRHDEIVIKIDADGTIIATRTTRSYNAREDRERQDTINISPDDIAGCIESMARAVRSAVDEYEPVVSEY